MASHTTDQPMVPRGRDFRILCIGSFILFLQVSLGRLVLVISAYFKIMYLGPSINGLADGNTVMLQWLYSSIISKYYIQ